MTFVLLKSRQGVRRSRCILLTVVPAELDPHLRFIGNRRAQCQRNRCTTIAEITRYSLQPYAPVWSNFRLHRLNTQP